MQAQESKKPRRPRKPKAEPPPTDAVELVEAEPVDGKRKYVQYSEELVDQIVQHLLNGATMTSISEMEGMPDRMTMFRWGKKHPELRQEILQAILWGVVTDLPEVKAIADDGRNDWMEKFSEEGELLGYRVNGEAIQRSTLRVNTRLRMAETTISRLAVMMGIGVVGGVPGQDGMQLPLAHAQRVAAELLGMQTLKDDDGGG